MRAMVMKTTPIIEKVITEEAELYCERRGSGPTPLLNDHKILQAVFVAGNIKAT
jgi:hypothetical protein